jgi:hypothetical protein
LIFQLVRFSLEAVTDGRRLGWLELIPGFTSDVKERVIEARCSYRNSCCEIHTEPGILFCMISNVFIHP